METDMIGVVARLKVKADMTAEFEAAAIDLVKAVNANEAGCLMYELYKSPKDSSSYVFMEKYADKAALGAHGKTDYFLAAQGKLGPCLAGPPDIQSLTPVA